MTQPPMTTESQALVSSLADQRHHVLGILEGLSEQDMQRPVLPSRWTCAGLVHHLMIDVERFWEAGPPDWKTMSRPRLADEFLATDWSIPSEQHQQ